MNGRTEQIRQFILDNFLFGNDEGLTENISFMEEGIIDSTGVLELVQYLEDTFSITIQDNELTPENLDSISNIVRFLESKVRTAEPLSA